MIQPTVSSTEGQQLVSPPGKGPISPDQALYKVKWSKYNFFKHLPSTIKSEDTEVLGGLRARSNEIKARSSRPTWKKCSLWLCNVHCWNATQYYSTETVLLIFPFLQTFRGHGAAQRSVKTTRWWWWWSRPTSLFRWGQVEDRGCYGPIRLQATALLA